MRFNFCGLALCLGLLTVANAPSAALTGEDPRRSLQNIRGSINIYRLHPVLISAAISKLGIPVRMIFGPPASQVSLTLSTMTAEDLLDAVVDVYPGYRWELSNGVVQILPPQPYYDEAFRILNSTIPAFASQGYDVGLTLSAFQGHCANHGLPFSDGYAKFARERPIWGGFKAAAAVDVSLPSGTRVLDALEAIAQKDRQAYWTLKVVLAPAPQFSIAGGNTKVYEGPSIDDVRQLQAIREGKISPYAIEVYSSDKLEHGPPK